MLLAERVNNVGRKQDCRPDERLAEAIGLTEQVDMADVPGEERRCPPRSLVGIGEHMREEWVVVKGAGDDVAGLLDLVFT